ncbi:hypothetical protein ACNKHR_25880 [Shigella flexneri]
MAKNLGIELTDDQLNITRPPHVNGLKKDPSLCLYAIPDGDVKGRVVAILLNDEVSIGRPSGQSSKALKAKGVHAKSGLTPERLKRLRMTVRCCL